MSKLFIQCNDNYTLNLLYNQNVLINITHIIYNIDNNYEDEETLIHIKELFKIKLKYRHIKTLLQVHITNELNIQEFIKMICNYGFDGVVFSIDNQNAINKCIQLSKVLNLLPEPYNFKWELYYININVNIFQNLKEKNEFIEILTGIIGININESVKIYDHTSDDINFGNLYIINLNRHVINLLMNMNKKYDIMNNITYPTSQFIRKIL